MSCPGCFTPRTDPVPIVQEAGWASVLVWMGAESLTPPLGFDLQTVQPIASEPITLSRPRLWRFSKPKWQLLLMFVRSAVHCGILKVYQLNTDL